MQLKEHGATFIMLKISAIKAREILDSRGNPTVEASVFLDGVLAGVSSVPSGASRGKYEALELRDEDPSRYGGMGVLKAITNVNEIIAPQILGFDPRNQLEIDKKMIILDGTPNKARLGANAILAVSLAVCEAAATAEKVSTYEHVGHLFGLAKDQLKMPYPIFNLINGGKHGAGNLDFQEFHLIPCLATFAQNLETGEEIYQAVGRVLANRGASHNVGDEGGFAPNLFTNLEALSVIKQASLEMEVKLNQDIFLGLDVAADYFYQNGRYKIKDRVQPMESDDLASFYLDLMSQYPLLSLEDPFQEDDWQAWKKLQQTLPKTLIVGDDLLATNRNRVEQAIENKACNSILIKPNQIGTISETIEVIKMARDVKWKVIVSHRSGETEENFIADFAVGVGADYVKFGAPARGERVVKYNRLLQIEEELT